VKQLAAGKSPKYRIRALKRRIASGTDQVIHHAHLVSAYAKGVADDREEVRRLEHEIARSTCNDVR
jgi:hypothetical protein